MLLAKRNILWVIILAILIRFVLTFLDFSFDVNNHIAWGKDALKYGLSGFYETRSSEVYGTAYPNYPPLAIYLFAPLYWLNSVVHSLVWQINLAFPLFPSKIMVFVEDRRFLAGIMKLPALVFDFILASLFYLFAKKEFPKKPKLHFLAPTLVLLNPALIYISAFWGQIDVVPIAFALASLYLALYTKRSNLSLCLFMLGLMVKPNIIIYLPVFFLVWYRKFGLQKMFIGAFLANLIFWLLFLPFYRTGNLFLFPYQTFLNKILAAQSLQWVNNSALNFWLIIPNVAKLKDTLPALLGLSFRLWGYLIWGTISILVLKKYHKDPIRCLFLITFAAFFFLTRMHERYIFLAWPFFTLQYLKNRKLLPSYLLFNLLVFLNIYKSFALPRIELLVVLFETYLFKASLSVLTLWVLGLNSLKSKYA